MRDDDVLVGTLIEESWLTPDQLAHASGVDGEWLLRHLDAGLFPRVEGLAGVLRFSGSAMLRARRMWRLEHDFDAGPELAALVADLQDEIDRLRAALRGIRR